MTTRIPSLAHRACAVCGSEDLATDEAHDRGRWLLGECRRCRHRWTVGPLWSVGPAPAIWRVPAPVGVSSEEDAAAA